MNHMMVIIRYLKLKLMLLVRIYVVKKHFFPHFFIIYFSFCFSFFIHFLTHFLIFSNIFNNIFHFSTIFPFCKEPPRITFTPDIPSVVQPGQNISISCDVTGEKPITIEWHYEDYSPFPE